MDRGARLRALRAAKEAWEIEAIRRAGAIADGALALAPKLLRPGATMRQAIAAIDREVRRRGAEDARYLVASGPQAGISLRPVGDRALTAGDTVLLSMSVQFQRYWAETARTFVLGKVPAALAALYDSAAAALDAMRGATRGGVAAGAIAAAAEGALRDPAFAKVAGSYGFGHGIGLDAEEMPSVAHGVQDIVAVDATLALRVVLHGNGHGAAVAQTVLARPGDCVSLNGAATLIELSQ
jgi:Xaa-Pro dipeptidase